MKRVNHPPDDSKATEDDSRYEAGDIKTKIGKVILKDKV